VAARRTRQFPAHTEVQPQHERDHGIVCDETLSAGQLVLARRGVRIVPLMPVFSTLATTCAPETVATCATAMPP
jgi:hypothetical protein